MSGQFIKGNNYLVPSLLKYRISEEIINIGTGNQAITVADAENIIGVTILSNTNSLGAIMSVTSIFGSSRSKNRLMLQTFESPMTKFIAFDLEITSSQIVISNYTSQYSNNMGGLTPWSYQLGKMIIFRKEVS